MCRVCRERTIHYSPITAVTVAPSSPLTGAVESTAVFDGAAAAVGEVADAEGAAGDTGPYASIDAAKKPLIDLVVHNKNRSVK